MTRVNQTHSVSKVSSRIRLPFLLRSSKKTYHFVIEKRQKFVLAAFILSFMLFLSELQFGKSGVFIAFVTPFLTVLFLYWAVREDLKDRKYTIFILPFFFSLAFGLFYFLVPARMLFRVILSILYAFGLYSLLLSQNIFTVSSIRTIQLLSGARIVSFVVTLVSFFLLSNIVFTLHAFLLPVLGLFLLYSYPLIHQSLWTYNLQQVQAGTRLWTMVLLLMLIEIVSLLWFWPSSPTVLALFLTGFFYTIIGLSHVWFERRLFRGVLWEYVWVGAVVFFVLILFSQWGK